MLALTDRAVKAVKQLISASEGTSETAGLRMSAEPAGPEANFQLRVVTLPAEDDEVVEEHGARVFLDPGVSQLLGDKVLDAKVEQGKVAFTLADQASE